MSCPKLGGNDQRRIHPVQRTSAVAPGFHTGSVLVCMILTERVPGGLGVQLAHPYVPGDF